VQYADSVARRRVASECMMQEFSAATDYGNDFQFHFPYPQDHLTERARTSNITIYKYVDACAKSQNLVWGFPDLSDNAILWEQAIC